MFGINVFAHYLDWKNRIFRYGFDMTFYDYLLNLYLYFLVFTLGLVMGSFLHCFSYRYSVGKKVSNGRSFCPACKTTLTALDLVPLFSYLFSKGKCRHCGKKISFIYPLSEFILGAIYLIVVLKFGFSLNALNFIVLMSLLFTASFTDYYCKLIPDRLTAIGFLFIVLSTLFVNRSFMSVFTVIVNGLSISLPLLLIVLAFDKITGKESMGGGDIKLTFLIGLFFNWKYNYLILMLACFYGIIFIYLFSKQKDKPFAFAPSLSFSAFTVMLFGEYVVRWYLGFF